MIPERSRLVMLLWLSIGPIVGCNDSNDDNETPDAGSVTMKDPRTIFSNVTVLTMTENDKKTPLSVIVEEDRIVDILKPDEVTVLETDTVIDATDEYLIPGLADMHAHVYSESEMVRYLAHGVTIVRLMSGADFLLQMRDAVNAGERVGPTLIVATPIIDGPESTTYSSIQVSSIAEIEEYIDRFADEGYDQIKLYQELSRDMFFAGIDAAHAHGLKAVGHVPTAVSTSDAFTKGYDSSEHLIGVMKALESGDPGFHDEMGGSEYYLRAATHVDLAETTEVAELARDNGVWLVPTLEVLKVIIAQPEQWETWSKDPRVEQIPNATKQYWASYEPARTNIDPSLFEKTPDAWENLLEITRKAHKAGAKLLIGTDYGNPYIYPGDCVHRELANFVEAGISNKSTLAAATALPAEFLEQQGAFGTIEAGARADLVLLNENPMEDIEATSDIAGVMVRGRWFDRADLDAMLETGSIPGQETKDPDEGKKEITCSGKASGEEPVIEDFDDGDAYIEGDGREGGMWYTFDDGTNGEISPDMSDWYTTPGGAGGEGDALHVKGEGYTYWGAGIGVTLKWVDDGYCTYDASYWDGFTFYAKGNATELTVGFTELDVIPVEEGGPCESECYGPHIGEVVLDECWRRYAFYFDELTPVYWGGETGAINPEELISLEFSLLTSDRFEFWLDDIAFFKGDKPGEDEICEMQDGGVTDGGAVNSAE